MDALEGTGEEQRLTALRRYDLLDTPAEPAFDDLARLAAFVCGTPMALVSLVDAGRQWFKARVGVSLAETPRQQSFCAHAIRQPGAPMVVPDASRDERFHANPLVTGDLHLRFYAGTPLLADGQPLGTLCVLDRVPRNLGPDQLAALEMLGRQAESQLQLRLHVTQLRQAAAARAEVERLKDEFIGVVSHELRTPLTSIRGSLGLLAGGLAAGLPDQARRMLDIALANTNRLMRLINDILDIERMESGQAVLTLTDCDAAALMASACDTLRPVADKAGVALAVEPLAAALRADPDRVEQVLTNLLSNAVKFAPAGSTVRLTAELAGEDVVFRVEDEGRGVPADKLEAIFGRFQQVDALDSREKGGTGLGLAICRSIAQQHGGRVWAENRPGAGSVFTLALPARGTLPVVPTPEPPRRPPAGMELRPEQRAQDLRVLVVEDDDQLAHVLLTRFAAHGLRTDHARTGRQAVQMLEQGSPDVVVLDLGLPQSDGFAVVDWLRSLPYACQVPLLIYSGRELDAGQRQRLQLGRTDFLLKGQVQEDELEKWVLAALGLRPAGSGADGAS